MTTSPAPSNARVTQGQESAPIPLAFLTVFLLLAHGLYLIGTNGMQSLLDGVLADTDCYMRLVRVLQLHETGEWFNNVIPRSNAPYGEEMHWTRPLDILLLAGAWLGSFVVPFPKALHWWGVVISPILECVAVLGLVFAARPFFDRDRLSVLIGLIILQPAILTHFLLGRPDHHSLLLACFAWTFAFTVHVISGCAMRWLLAAYGFVAALGVWVSIEAFLGLAVSFSMLTLAWVLGEKGLARKSFLIASSLLLVATLAMILEHPLEQLLVQEYDRFSIPHWFLLFLLWVFWAVQWVIAVVVEASSTRFRLLAAIISGMVLSAVAWAVFPKLFSGPRVDVDPFAITLFWDHVMEAQPLISSDPWRISLAVIFLGFGLIGVPYYVTSLIKKRYATNHPLWGQVLIGLCVFLPLAFLQIRFAPYAALLICLPYADLLGKIGQEIGVRLKSTVGNISQTLVIFAGCAAFPLLGAAITQLEDPRFGDSEKGACPMIRMTEFLSNPNGIGNESKTILAFLNFGPVLLYHSPHRVIATPYHRNADGLRDAYRIMSATDDAQASQLIEARDVDLILLCPGSHERGYYSFGANTAPFYEELVNGRLPPWIRELPLPAELANHFRLYERVMVKAMKRETASSIRE